MRVKVPVLACHSSGLFCRSYCFLCLFWFQVLLNFVDKVFAQLNLALPFALIYRQQAHRSELPYARMPKHTRPHRTRRVPVQTAMVGQTTGKATAWRTGKLHVPAMTEDRQYFDGILTVR